MELPELNTEPKKRKTQSYVYAEPVYTKLLKEAMGVPAMSEALGIDKSTIRNGIHAGRIRKIMEVAAQGYYLEHYLPKAHADKTLLSMAVDKKTLDALEPWLKLNKIPYQAF